MNDRELLELAAKSCGYPISEGYYEESTNGAWWVYVNGSGEPPNDSAWTEIWNPQTDDGDALRLAVKLNLLVQFNARHIFVCDDAGVQLAFLGKKDDPYAATRRAIVRAAAEIGRRMT